MDLLEGAPVDTLADARPQTRDLAGTGSRALLVASLVLAWYTGFRTPNVFAITLYTPSLFDGFYRRFLVGTVLEPFARASHYNYWLFAGVSFAILLALLGVVMRLAFTTTSMSQRGLVILWLLLPTGGFLFHEVGYLEQLTYLLLFAAIWLVNRRHWWLASAAMALTVMAHENALLTVVPLFLFITLRDTDWKTVARVLAAPAIVAFGVLVLPPISHGTVATQAHRLAAANFTMRPDALALFTRTQAQSWKLYAPWTVFGTVLPAAVALSVAFLVINRRQKISSSLRYTVLGTAAIAAPALLSFGGWDINRWEFLTISNAMIVLWVWLEDRGTEFSATELVVLASALVVATHNGIPYFYPYRARPLSFHDIGQFVTSIANGSRFRIPNLKPLRS